MSAITREKLVQTIDLVAKSDADVWLTFVRETTEGGDPVLPLLLEGGLTWQSALLVSASGRKVAIVGNYDAPPLESSGDWDSVVPYVKGIREPLLQVLDELVPDGGKIAVNYSKNDVKADGLAHGMLLLLNGYFEGTRFEGSLVSAEEIVMPLRGIKAAAEVEAMKKAIRQTDILFAEIAEFARVGVSEREIYDLVHSKMRERNLGFAWDPVGDPIVNSGPNSMIGHGIPSASITLQRGHIFHIDLGVISDGYSSDIQRSWYVCDPLEEIPIDVDNAFNAVYGAISAGAAVLRPGVPGHEVDAAARAYLVRAGYEEYHHALGHQVGRVAHDGGAILGPTWERYGRTPYIPVSVGEVYTLELGIILEGRGYLGLEEMVQVEEDGLIWLTNRQTQLMVIPCE